MEKVLCVSYLDKNKSNIVYGEDIQDKCPWVENSLKTKKTPKGLPLKACEWHSSVIQGDNNDPEKCDVRNPADYSIWVTGYICYDTCNVGNDINKKKEAEENNVIEKVINNYGKWFISAVDLHQMFYSDLHKKEEIKNELIRLEKKLDILSKGVNNNDAVYVSLLEMQKRTKNLLANKIENMTNIYNNSKIKNEELQAFVDRHSSEEILNFQKAKSDLQRWYNSNSNIDTKELVYNILKLRKSQEVITTSLNNSYKMPFSYLYKAKDNLSNIIYFLKKYQLNRNYTYEEAIEDKNRVERYLSFYNSFIEGKDVTKIVEEVEREQFKSIQEERDLKLNKSVKKISNNSNAIVVKLDGTVERNVKDEQLMIGSIVNQGDWRNETTNVSDIKNVPEINAVKDTVNDDKWKSLRG
jgi:hypothetical protein